MPPRKISIADALSALKTHGVTATITMQSETVPHPMDTPPVTKVLRAPKGYVKVTLYAKHNLTHGGELVPGTKRVVGSGLVSYGPGVVDIPENLAAQVLKQDQVTRLGDERFRSTEQRSYLVVQRRGPSGAGKFGLQVPNEVLDSGFDLSKISQLNEHNVRNM